MLSQRKVRLGRSFQEKSKGFEVGTRRQTNGRVSSQAWKVIQGTGRSTSRWNEPIQLGLAKEDRVIQQRDRKNALVVENKTLEADRMSWDI